jgi:HEAT repeat protein
MNEQRIACVVLAVSLFLPAAGEAEPAAQGKPAGQWVEMLRSPEAQTRRQAVLALGKMKSAAKEAVPALVEVLRNDKDVAVRRMAVRALGQVGPAAKEAVAVLIEAMQKDPDDIVQEEAIRALGGIGPEARAAIPALVKVLGDRTRGDWDAPATALGQIGAEAVAPVIPLLRSHEGYARGAAEETLTQIGAPAVPAVLEVLGDDNAAVRLAAVQVLHQIGPKGGPAVPALVRILRDKDGRVRRAAVRALGATGPEGLRALCEALRAPEEDLRREAAQALAELGTGARAAAPALTAALKDDSPRVRVRAAEALWCVGGDRDAAIRTLVAPLETIGCRQTPAGLQVAQEALQVLARLGPDAAPAVPALTAVLKAPPPAPRLAAAIALRNVLALPNIHKAATLRLPTADALRSMSPQVQAAEAALTGALQDADAAVRLIAAETAVHTRPGERNLVPTLLDLLKAPAGPDRARAARALRVLGPGARAAVPQLIAMVVKDADFSAQTEAAATLGRIGPEAAPAVPVLIAALRHGSNPAAIDALGGIGPGAKEAVPVLINELTRIRKCVDTAPQAAAALVKIGKAAVPELVGALQSQGSAQDAGRVQMRRWAVVDLLGSMGPEAKAAVPALRELLKDRDEALRKQVARALERIEPQAGR